MYNRGMLDNFVYTPGPLPSTEWIENELRRIYAEREQWQARWVTLKHWLGSRRADAESTTLSLIEQHMIELEQQHLQLPPQMPIAIFGTESE